MVITEKTKSGCIELKERLKKVKRQERNGIVFVMAYCIVAGIISSQFLFIGFSIWLFVAFVFVWALMMIYSGRASKIKRDEEKMGCED